MRIGSIVIHCCEFDKRLAFWQEALHDVPREPAKSGWVVLRDPNGRSPNVSLNQTAKPRTSRSRLHLDLYTDNQKAEVKRLVAAGATLYPWRYRPGADFVVLEDPDGNLFCIVQKPRRFEESAHSRSTLSQAPPARRRPLPDHTSGANNLTGAMTRVLELLFADKNDVVTSVIAGTTPIQYNRFYEMADDVMDVRVIRASIPLSGRSRTKVGQAIRRLGGQSRPDAD